jgi:hypothetical protein
MGTVAGAAFIARGRARELLLCFTFILCWSLLALLIVAPPTLWSADSWLLWGDRCSGVIVAPFGGGHRPLGFRNGHWYSPWPRCPGLPYLLACRSRHRGPGKRCHPAGRLDLGLNAMQVPKQARIMKLNRSPTVGSRPSVWGGICWAVPQIHGQGHGLVTMGLPLESILEGLCAGLAAASHSLRLWRQGTKRPEAI